MTAGPTTVDLNGNTMARGYFSGIGEDLTRLDAGNISSGTLDDARLSANVTLQGNAFNGPSQLVKLDASGSLALENAGGYGTPGLEITAGPGGNNAMILLGSDPIDPNSFPILDLFNNSAATDQRSWRVVGGGDGELTLNAFNDDGSVPRIALRIGQEGGVLTQTMLLTPRTLVNTSSDNGTDALQVNGTSVFSGSQRVLSTNLNLAAASGWYRIADLSGAGRFPVEVRLHMEAGPSYSHNGEVVLMVVGDPYNQAPPVLNCLAARTEGSQAITQARLATNGIGTQYLDVYLQTGGTDTYLALAILQVGEGDISGAGAFNPSTSGYTLTTVSLPARGAALAPLLIPSGAPASSSAAGAAGQIEWDANYVYICTAANTWKRAALSSW